MRASINPCAQPSPEMFDCCCLGGPVGAPSIDALTTEAGVGIATEAGDQIGIEMLSDEQSNLLYDENNQPIIEE